MMSIVIYLYKQTHRHDRLIYQNALLTFFNKNKYVQLYFTNFYYYLLSNTHIGHLILIRNMCNNVIIFIVPNQ